MDQKSDAVFRAEKEYKNSREKFYYLLREVVSNAIHAVIIRKSKDAEEYSPFVRLEIDLQEDSASISVFDNGEGFNEANRKYFTNLDSQNPDKAKLHLHPKGQGRLAILYFSNSSTFTSVYKANNGELLKSIFNYPDIGLTLFDIEEGGGVSTDEENTFTKIDLKISKQQALSRAKTFFKKYPDIEALKSWFIETFFPFFIENEDLNLELKFNGQPAVITKKYIESNVRSIPFSLKLNIDEPKDYAFKVWLVQKVENSRIRSNSITCFARHLKAELVEGKLEYDIDLPISYDWMLTSDFFDGHVDPKGDKIEIDQESLELIQEKLESVLDEHFKSQIEKNKKDTRKNILAAKTKYHSLSMFVDESKISETKKVIKESDIIASAIEIKGKIEKAYWSGQDQESDEVGKLLNSSLHIYIDHRKNVLSKFEQLIKRFDVDGSKKSELEASIHELLMRRGENFRNSADINQLHNLWILDDKFAIFSDTRKTVSTKNGQGLSDIYFWIDDPKKSRELLILELKSTTKAHNAGDKYESMVAQVRKYASSFYKDPEKVLNWNVNTDSILYSGIILARKSDIYKELHSNNSGSRPNKIPFLESSYYFNDSFSAGRDDSSPPIMKDIRIEMFSYEDIHSLASDRNEVFLNLLNGEFQITDDIEVTNDLATDVP